MARIKRAVAVDVPHHVTQRGNTGRRIFDTDADRTTYLDLLRQYCSKFQVSILAWCLMNNHVHLVATPSTPQGFALALRYAHGRYAAYLNARQAADGHVWQGRFFSCALDTPHLWAAMRYVELNPVRAGMVRGAETYQWSSAQAHSGGGDRHAILDLTPWLEAWTAASWREFLNAGCGEDELTALRGNTHTGRPLGANEFVHELEHNLGRPLAPRPGGRPPGNRPDPGQMTFEFRPARKTGNVQSVPGFSASIAVYLRAGAPVRARPFRFGER